MDKNTVPSKAMVEKLLKVNGYGERLDMLLRDYPLLIALPYLMDREAAKRDADRFIHPEKVLASFHGVYSKYLSADQILDLIAFYKTPTGRVLVEFDEAIRKEMQDEAVKLAYEIAAEMLKENIKKPPEEEPPADLLDTENPDNWS